MPKRRPRRPGSRLAAFEQRALDIQRWLFCAVLVVAPLVFWRATLDIFGIAKAAAVAVLAIAVVAVAGFRAVRTGRIVLPVHPAVLVVVAFLALAVIATITSYAPALSLTGHYARYSGLIMYTLYAVLFVAVLRAFDLDNIRLLAYAALTGGAGVGLYGLVQVLGIDPIPWGEHVGITSTLGNPNYVSAHAGIAVAPALWLLASRTHNLVVRAFGAPALVALAAALFGAGSNQGFIAGAAGGAVLVLAWLRTHSGDLRRFGQWAWGAAVTSGAVVFFTGILAGRGPISFIPESRSFRMRSHDMLAGWNILRDHPILGVGFDRFGGYYHSHRAAEATNYQELAATTSTPHSVHLNMFVSGGILLGLAYLAFIAIIAWALLRAVRDLDGERLLLVGGLGGSWVAYQTASMISIDVPSLAASGWVLAGAALVVADPPRLRTWWLPWVGPPVEGKNKAARRARGKRAVRRRQIGTPAAISVGLAAAVALWPIWLFLKADVHAKDSERLRSAGEHETAVLAATEAYELNPWEPRYGTVLGQAVLATGNNERALDVFEETVERDPRSIGPVVTAARLSEQVGDMERAERWYRRAIELEPNDPRFAAEAGRFFLRIEEYEVALERYEHALSLRDGRAEWWVRLGFARENIGDEDGAREAYEKALALDPDDEEARSQLARLDGDA